MIGNGEYVGTVERPRPGEADRIEHAKDAIDAVLHALARHGGTGETVIVGEVARHAGTSHETAGHLVRAVVMGLSQVDSKRTALSGSGAVATMPGTRVTTARGARPRRHGSGLRGRCGG